jgi:cell division protein FtsN
MANRLQPRAPHRSGAGGTLVGLFIGLALGLALAAGVAYYLAKSGISYQQPMVRDSAKDPGKSTRSEPTSAEKPRFDFYRILPGLEEAKIQPKFPDRATPDRATVERAASPDKTIAKVDERASAAPGSEKQARALERYWLQAGSFMNEADAENLKARLAFAGWEATVLPATLPDKTTRYRVRLGPYDNTDELTRMKNDLAGRGFDVAVIKN